MRSPGQPAALSRPKNNHEGTMGNRESLSYYLRAALAHRWMVVTPAVLLFVAATAWTATQPDVYEGKAVLMAQTTQPSLGLFPRAVQVTERDMFRGTQERLYKHDIMSRIITERGLYADTVAASGMDSAVARFRGNVTVLLNPNSGSVTVSFRHSGGERPAEVAADVVNALVDRFVDNQRDAVAAKAVELKGFVAGRLAILGRELSDAQTKLKAFQLDHAGSLPEDRQGNESAIAQAQDNIEEYIERQKRNQDEIERYTIASFELKNQLEQPGANVESGDWLANAMSQHLATLKSQLARDLTVWSEDSDTIRSRKTQIEETEKRLQELEAKDTKTGGPSNTKVFYQYLLDMNQARQEDLRRDCEMCERRVDEEKQRIAAARRLLEAIPSYETEYAELRRTVADAEARRNAMFAKQEQVDVTIDYGDHDQSVPLELEQRAFAASAPVGPRRLTVSLAGFVLGLMLGSGLVVLRARLDQTFRRSEDLRYLLPGSVLVTLPDVRGAGSRTGAVVGNVVAGVVLTGLFLGAVTVLGIQLGWWGHAEMLKPLLQFAGQ
jgi:uncharacterized protein involved in exopolysaccharide biosynthesis